MKRVLQVLSVVVACIWICAAQAEQEQVLDDFENISSWKLVLSHDVSGTLRRSGSRFWGLCAVFGLQL